MKPQKSKENPGFCWDFESLQRLRNQEQQLRDHQVVSRGRWSNHSTGVTLASWIHPTVVTSVGLQLLLLEPWARFCAWACALLSSHRAAGQTAVCIFSILRQQSNQVSQTQLSTFLRGELSMVQRETALCLSDTVIYEGNCFCVRLITVL